MTRLIPKLTFLRSRLRILVGVFGALVAHVAEVWLFAFAYYFMLDSGRYGSLEGNFNGTLMDASYFSFTTYTSLGFGDIEPLGDIRFLVGLEALTGLVLITWTASFMFIEMQRFWIIQSDS
ncbi:potassium channel family protein [Leucothrix pacifica]|uniref:potassium channel family protein n=1 Tax=Leucothrix pacifica TaxID=1247513 RepID=UPI001FE609DB|nr:potassium channel family protein [Leucothrix pacifica]